MRITLIRHGKTAGNAELRYIGRTDEPLAQEGVAKLSAMRSDYTVKVVYVSPLQRTQQTAAILFPNAERIVVDDLREMDFGDFEGRSYREMADDAAYCAWLDSGCMAPCSNGESRIGFSDRVCAAFREILDRARAREEQELVFVIHGGTIMAVMERFAVPKKDFYAYSVKNCSGYTCDTVWSKDGMLALDHVALWK